MDAMDIATSYPQAVQAYRKLNGAERSEFIMLHNVLGGAQLEIEMQKILRFGLDFAVYPDISVSEVLLGDVKPEEPATWQNTADLVLGVVNGISNPLTSILSAANVMRRPLENLMGTLGISKLPDSWPDPIACGIYIVFFLSNMTAVIKDMNADAARGDLVTFASKSLSLIKNN